MHGIIATEHPEFPAWDGIITIHQLLFPQELTFQRRCNSSWQKASSFTSTCFQKKKKKRETDSSERWKDSEVDRWSLSKWRHSASVRYITDEKREDSNMNAPVLTSTSARGLPCALETLPCGVEIHVRALTRKHDVHRGAHVCIMYVSCKYSYAYMDVHSPVSPPIHLPTCLLYLQSKDSKPQLSLSYELPTRLISTRAPWRLL